MSTDAELATAAQPAGAVVTASASEWDDPEQPQPRDRWQRPLIELPEASDESQTKAYQRMSTVAGALTEGTALRVFLQQQLAVGLVKAPDLQGVIAGLDLDDKGDRKTLNELIETAMDRAGGKAKALWGTAVHRFTEPGAPMDWTPPDMVPDVASYWRETEARGIRRVLSEQFVVNDRYAVAGTFDGAFYVPGWSDGPDGGLLLGDVKTGGLHPGQHAMQLAGYAGGCLYDHRKPLGLKRTDLPRIRQDVGLLLHVPKGEGDTVLYLIDLQAGRDGLDLARAVFDYRARNDLAQLFDAVAPPRAPEVGVGPEWTRCARCGVDLGGPGMYCAEHTPASERPLAGADDDAPMQAKVRTAIEVRREAEAHRATTYADVPQNVPPVLDVNGNPVDLKGDGFDDLRVSDPAPTAGASSALVAHHLGGQVLDLREQVASAATESVLTRLWENHQGEWTPELTQLARDRMRVLEPGRA